MKSIFTTFCLSIAIVFCQAQSNLIITEIMYNPPEAGTDSLEYIEIYNNGMVSIDLTGYYFSAGVIATFPAMSIAPASYVVVANTPSAIANNYGYIGAVPFLGGLSNGGENVVLNDALGNMVDSVNYDDALPFPTGSAAGEPDGGGASIEFCILSLDNTLGGNWTSSTQNSTKIINGLPLYGSPGASDVACSTFIPLEIKDISLLAKTAGEHNLLSWVVFGEKNIVLYTIYGKTTNQNFEPLGQIMSSNPTSTLAEKLSYTFLHQSPSTQNWDYKLTFTDIDGNEKTVKEISLKRTAQNGYVIYPSIVNNELNINCAKEKVQLYLINMSGDLVHKQTLDQANGSWAHYKINVANNPNGLYLLRLVDLETQTTTVEKIIIKH